MTLLSPSRAVSMTTGTSLLFLSSWQRLIPSIPGSIMSRRTRSNAPADRKRFSADSPSPTASTLIPSRSRAICTMSLTARSSSTISMLGIYARLRQLDIDRCPYAFSRTDGDTTAHSLCKLLTNGQPQTKSLGAAPALVEALENVREVNLTYPESLVFHGNATRTYANPDISAPVRVLYSVAE